MFLDDVFLYLAVVEVVPDELSPEFPISSIVSQDVFQKPSGNLEFVWSFLEFRRLCPWYAVVPMNLLSFLQFHKCFQGPAEPAQIPNRPVKVKDVVAQHKIWPVEVPICSLRIHALDELVHPFRKVEFCPFDCQDTLICFRQVVA